MPYKMPQVGKTMTARITRIEQKTAEQVYTSKKTGKFEGKYSKPSDKVYEIYGKAEGESEERRLGVVNAPRNPEGVLYGTSKLFDLLVKAGFEPSKAETISEDLHELKGRKIQVTVDSKGFMRL